MRTFKVQRIRSCSQCRDLLPLKCGKCLVHPERTAKVIELYGWPPILSTGACGCIKIACQRVGCTNTAWRYPKKNKDGLSVSRSLYCGKECAMTAQHRQQETFEMVPCLYCGVPRKRKQSDLKRHARVFCHREHYFLFLAKKRHEDAEERSPVAREENVGLMYCGKCCDVTEHLTPKASQASCRKCKTRRGQASSSMDCAETMSMKYAETGKWR